MKKTFIKTMLAAIVVVTVMVPTVADATCNYSWNWMASACERVTRVANDGTWDLYVTGYGWHIDGYDDTSHLNSNSWGGGVGKHWTDANGHEDILFAVAFSDSHKQVEPIAGYARQWFTHPVLGGLSAGGGFFAGFTARQDVAHYLPVPLVLPIASLRYRKASVMATLLPRLPGINAGDVAFFWGRYEF
jgi:palmitoyl transferase